MSSSRNIPQRKSPSAHSSIGRFVFFGPRAFSASGPDGDLVPGGDYDDRTNVEIDRFRANDAHHQMLSGSRNVRTGVCSIAMNTDRGTVDRNKWLPRQPRVTIRNQFAPPGMAPTDLGFLE